MKKRLYKILIDNKLCSKRNAKTFIKNNEICINEQRIKNPDELVDIQVNNDKNNSKFEKKSAMFINGTEFIPKKYTYIIMNKPVQTVCKTVSDKNKTVYSLFAQNKLSFSIEDLHTVGRLDLDTEGLLLLTNNGDFSHKLTDPKSECPKTYFVELKNNCNKIEQERIKNVFSKPFVLPAEKKVLSSLCKGGILLWHTERTCSLIITEGQFHQVKRMFKAVQNEVIFLKRTKINNLELPQNLATGEWKLLSENEIELLYKHNSLIDS